MTVRPDPAPAPPAAPEVASDFHWFDIEADPASWDALVGDLKARVFHLSGLLEAHRFGRARRRGVLIARGGTPVAALGGLFTRKPGGARFQTLAFPPRRPALPGDLPGRLCAWLAAEGVADADLGSYDGGVEDYDVVPGAQITPRLEFPWTLEAPEALRAALHSNHRRKLSKLAKAGLELRPITRRPAAVLTRVRRHWEERRGEDASLMGWLRLHGFNRRLDREVGRRGHATLYGLFDHTTLLSAAYMLEHADRAFYMLGASSPEGYRAGASVGLFMDLAAHYLERDVRVLNLGGVPADAEKDGHDEHGVYRFKTGFGIRPVPRASLRFRPEGTPS
jgi:Acetyltransferase (GNAT) domain